MLVLTYHDTKKHVLVMKEHVIYLEEAQPQGTLVHMVRGVLHVAQSLSQVQAQLTNYSPNKG